MKELFTLEPTLSPFETWKRDNKIKTHFWSEADKAEEWPWLASAPGCEFGEIGPDECGGGQTEIEACYDCARKYKLIWFQNGKIPQ